MNKILTSLAFLFVIQVGYGQDFFVSGKVEDLNGYPLAYASVYVENTTYGVSTDQKGRYRIAISKPEVNLVFSYIGYEPKSQSVQGRKEEITLNVKLKAEPNALLEAQVVGDTRDRAKAIMQKVRDNRRTFRKALDSYTSNTYNKIKLERESVDTTQLEAVEFNQASAEQFIKENLVLKETLSKLDYERDQRYKETIYAQRDYTDREVPPAVKSLSLSFEIDQGDIAPLQRGASNPYVIWEGMESCDFDFYDNLIAFDRITDKPLMSPIAAQSALSYRYDYDGLIYEEGKGIHKIKVTPLYKQETLFSGMIFIEDSTYALTAVDLEINPPGMHYCNRFRIIQDYDEVEPGIFVPVRRELDYTIPDGRDKVLGKIVIIQDGYEVNKAFDFGYFGGELKRFEPDAFEQSDSLWSNQRPMKLDKVEMKFIDKADSISAYLESDEFYAKQDSAFNHIDWWAPLIGIGHRNRKKGTEWYIEGLVGQINPVGIGGYRHRLPGSWQKILPNNDLIEVDGFIDYGFRNRDIKGNVGFGWTYRPDKAMRTYVKVGDFYEMINTYASIEQIFSRSNYARNKTLFVSQRMEIVNGLYGELAFDFADQIPITGLGLSNWSNQLFGELNEPSDFNRYTKSEIRLKLKYRINQRYIWKRGRKEVLGSNYPVLEFTYRKGVPGLFNSEVDYDFLEVTADHEITMGRWGDTHWEGSLGAYVNKRNLRILEHRYFRGSDRFFFSNPTRSFQLLGPTLSTADAFLQANFIHHFNGAIMDKIPLLNKTGLNLVVGGGVLALPGEDFFHVEAFAGLERTFRLKGELFRLGLYAVTSDNNLGRIDFTLKFGLNFFNTFTNKWEY